VLFSACYLSNFEIFSAIVGADFSGYSSLSKESGETLLMNMFFDVGANGLEKRLTDV